MAQQTLDAQSAPQQQDQSTKTLSTINVKGKKPYDWRKYVAAKLKHQMSEVSGTEITVTKKATVTHLDLQPTIVGNNLEQLFARSPGVLVSQQPTPTQFNLSYRGLGNPQESEYVLVMQDGIPLESDWIGFPTLYAMPFSHSIADIQLIRGGASLLYGPEPAPVINMVSKRPKPGTPFSISTEQVVGDHGLYSTYNVLEGSAGKWTYRADAGYVRSDGTRRNAQSQMRQADLYVEYRPNDQQYTWLDVHAIDADSGDAGRMSYPQWQLNPDATPTPWNRDWVDRYQLVLGHQHEWSNGWLFIGKLWAGYQDLASRAANGAPAPDLAPKPPPSSTTLQDEQFRTQGLDARVRKKWDRATPSLRAWWRFMATIRSGSGPTPISTSIALIATACRGFARSASRITTRCSPKTYSACRTKSTSCRRSGWNANASPWTKACARRSSPDR